MLDPNSRRTDPGGALEGSVGPSTSRILPIASDAFVNQRDAFFRARLREPAPDRIRRASGPDMNLTMLSNWLSPKIRPENFAELFLFRRRNLEPKFLFQRRLGPRRHDVLELGAQNFPHRPVKFRRLRHAHAMDFDAHDVKARAGKKINHVAGASRGEAEIVRLDEHQCALRLLARPHRPACCRRCRRRDPNSWPRV